MRDRMDEEWREHSGHVAAPAEMWGKVQGGSPRRAAPRFNPIWATAAAFMLITVAGWSMWKASTQPLELHSASASEVHNWVLANAGLDVPLPAKQGSLVEILGASIDRAVAKISYRVGELRATLLVKKDVSGDTPHKGTEMSSTWTMGGQSYTLAVAGPGDLRTACLLCHSAPGAALY